MAKSYSEILIEMADSFDSYIAPKKIRRSNTNFIYLILKAVAKGYERIMSMIDSVSGKFNPEVSSDSDLESIAKIAGTQRLVGQGSGLVIKCKNNSTEDVTLVAGEYKYEHTAEAIFYFTVGSDTVLSAAEELTFAAFTTLKDSVSVEAVSSLPVFRVDEATISEDLSFSCTENSLLLGYPDETNVAFRKRILDDTERQDTIKELEISIANLPYIFDCRLQFNQTDSNQVVDGVTIPPYHLLVILSGDFRNDIAEIISRYGIYPTVEVDPAKVLYFYSDVFVDGAYPVFYKTFDDSTYDLKITYVYNDKLITNDIIQEQISAALQSYKDNLRHSKYVTEAEFYDRVRALQLPSVMLLDIELSVDSTPVTYVEIPPTRVPKLDTITFDGTVQS